MGTFRLALLFLDRWVQQTSKNDLLIVPSDEAEVEELRHLSSRYARYPTHYGRVVASVRRGRGVLGAIAPSAEIGTHNSAR